MSKVWQFAKQMEAQKVSVTRSAAPRWQSQHLKLGPNTFQTRAPWQEGVEKPNLELAFALQPKASQQLRHTPALEQKTAIQEVGVLLTFFKHLWLVQI